MHRTLMGVFHMSDENMLPMSLLLDSVLAGAAAGSGAFAGSAGLFQLKPPKAGAAGACGTVMCTLGQHRQPALV